MKIGPLPSRRAASHHSSVSRRDLRLSSGMVRRAGCWTIDLGCKTDAISLEPRPAAPIEIFRHPVLEPSDRVEHGAPHEHRGGDSEAEVLDVALVLEGEDALERFGGRHPPRILDQDVDPPADEIRRQQLGEALFEPAPVRPAVAVDERERVASRCANPGIAGRSGAALGDLDAPGREFRRSAARRRARANCRCLRR